MSKTGRRGCFGKGCLILVVLLFAGAGLGAWQYYRWSRSMRDLTASQPARIPIALATPQQYDALRARMDAFVRSPAGSPPLILSAEHLNTLIAQAPEWNAARGLFSVKIPKDRLQIQGSLDLDKVWGFGRQYLNGALEGVPLMSQDSLRFRIDKIAIQGQQIPRTTLDKYTGIAERAFVSWAQADPILRPILKKTSDVRVENDRLIFWGPR